MAIKISTLFAASGYVKALAKEPRQSVPFGNFLKIRGCQIIVERGQIGHLNK